MASPPQVMKNDPSTDLFQRRAQMAKEEACRIQWFENWGWLLEEKRKLKEESDAARDAVKGLLPTMQAKEPDDRCAKPVPVTSTGFIGWLAMKPEFHLEKYKQQRLNIPAKAPEAWDK